MLPWEPVLRILNYWYIRFQNKHFVDMNRKGIDRRDDFRSYASANTPHGTECVLQQEFLKYPSSCAPGLLYYSSPSLDIFGGGGCAAKFVVLVQWKEVIKYHKAVVNMPSQRHFTLHTRARPQCGAAHQFTRANVQILHVRAPPSIKHRHCWHLRCVFGPLSQAHCDTHWILHAPFFLVYTFWEQCAECV